VSTLFRSSWPSFPGHRWIVLGGANSGPMLYATPIYDILVLDLRDDPAINCRWFGIRRICASQRASVWVGRNLDTCTHRLHACSTLGRRVEGCVHTRLDTSEISYSRRIEGSDRQRCRCSLEVFSGGTASALINYQIIARAP
jgi:hypothetical protein